ncbi:putative nicotinate-nucleotide adenylyltransferase [Formosimonas limnophila]|uniref:Probable nicotinate-nucleotide adenylyltransferase n=1 Tax=Formosimonas limnophila TaxID=1384487 RepID=A0A8J3CLN9_9BURK|nr:nicotinate (nicotinamide) nucleotide adenylyltransferase [Formosimonas limnophila]GHA74628.1 putative nicotinate-nucleotide adenylyltransferase [Formosimonas limnophila]
MSSPIGLFGSSFNPPHLAHFALLHAAREQLKLSSIQVIPAGQPWQKPHVIASVHRVAMVKAALNDDAQNWEKQAPPPYPITLNSIEASLSQPSYTIQTLKQLSSSHPTNTPLVWIMGSDQLSNLTTWHRWDELLNLCHIAVAQRAGHEVTADDLHESLKSYYLTHLSQADEWQNHPNGYFVTFNLPKMHISSSAIRAALKTPTAENQAILSQLSPSVAAYIQQHQLYGDKKQPHL